MDQAIDLKKEQEATLARPRYGYSASAKVFFNSMDALTGPENTLHKAKVIESLASVPYRAWENRQYRRLTRHYPNPHLVQEARPLMSWGREAQDNEFQHLRVIGQKLWEDDAHDPRYLTRPLPELMVSSYMLMSGTLARLGIQRAFLLNAEFEDHAEHTYAEMVLEHPEWEEQPVTGDAVLEYAAFHGLDGFGCWADVFRRIMLDERDHRNASFAFAGMPEHIVRYEGMLELPGLEAARRREARPHRSVQRPSRTSPASGRVPVRVHWTPMTLARHLVRPRRRPEPPTPARPAPFGGSARGRAARPQPCSRPRPPPLQAAGGNPPPAEIRALLYEAAVAHDIPPRILYAIAWQESTWRQFDATATRSSATTARASASCR